tara:strand:- start:806 stop:973 length:168 start_codon:yes stop_codon:yes gene_type:complete
MLDLLDLFDWLIRRLKPPIGKHWGWWLLWAPMAGFCLASIALLLWFVAAILGLVD